MQFTTLLSLYSIALSLPTSDIETGLTEEVDERSVSASSEPVNLCCMCGSSCGSSCGCGGCDGCNGSSSSGCTSGGCSSSGLMSWSHAAVRWRQEHAQQVQLYAQQHANELVGQQVAKNAVHYLNNLHSLEL